MCHGSVCLCVCLCVYVHFVCVCVVCVSLCFVCPCVYAHVCLCRYVLDGDVRSGGRALERRTVNRGDGGSIPPTAVSKLEQFRLPFFRKRH